jgi:uncharacterized membrane protein YfcA
MKEWLISNPIAFEAFVAIVALGAGFLGALLGIGGGFILIPFLTLGLGIDIRYAIGASLVSVIATSSGAAANYVRDHFTNVRTAIFLEIGTTFGAITGAMLASLISTRELFLLFAVLLLWSSVAMARRRETVESEAPVSRLAHDLRLHSAYPSGGKMVPYRVARPMLGLGLMYVAGCVSALLGIGSGTLKVPAMDQAMRLPIKVSSATSNFMMGVTAAASAGIYFMRGNILPGLAAPVAFGVLIGSKSGSRYLSRANPIWVRRIFVLVMVAVAIQMGVKGVQAFRE